jgi:hypothetical protein
MGLAGAAIAERDSSRGAERIPNGAVQDQHFVKTRDGGELECVEALHRWEVRRADPRSTVRRSRSIGSSSMSRSR